MSRLITIAALVAALMATAPAQALTLEQAQAEVAGMHCAGSVCTSSVETTTTVELPDYTVSQRVTEYHWVDVILPPNGTYADKYEWAADGKWRAMKRKGVRTVTRLVDGGTKDVKSCTVTAKELIYNGPYTSRALAWSVNTSVATTPGAC